jgi:demethylmenaquinone methyltransferase/2-methoxy-6-polyprenyl-1,4-benzoquinol methylase
MLHTARTDQAAPAWDADTLTNPHALADKGARVEAMFDAIAPTYERVNTIASFGMDAVWRRRTVAAAEVRSGDVVLDVACGTGDLVRLFASHIPAPSLVIGADFSANMLGRGRYPRDGARAERGRGRSAAPHQLIRADAQRLPLADACVDVISCAFGVRNFQDLQSGLNEMGRVARPGARVVILEFTMPENNWRGRGYRMYCEHLLPRLATLISGDRTRAYYYLPYSVLSFESHEMLSERLGRAGFVNRTVRRMNFGTVALHRGEKPR